MKKIKKRKRDYTKYMFLGSSYGKSGLVLAVVKNYVKKNPKITIDELRDKFSKDKFHTSFEVIETVKKAKKKRFFLDKDDRIKAVDGILAVTNQWSKDNITPFITFVKKHLNLSIRQAA